MIVLYGIIFFLFGAAFGSFLNVVIYRMPRGESIVYPPSHCPVCGARISPKDNIPILSYIILKGRCRHCGARISPRYILVESITALIFLFGFLYYHIGFELFEFIVFSLILIPIGFIDWDTMLIPDTFSLGGIIVGLIFMLFEGEIINALIGGAVSAGIIYIFSLIGRWIFKKEAMGMGDVKLAGMLGVFLGWKEFILLLIIASFLGAIVGIALEIKGKLEDSRIPFAPFLAFAGFIIFIFGKRLMEFLLWM